ncbi:proton channel OtopLc-like [Diadema antillarum]|uniref:proton channel OtopLc-like n=1 Tax=Diadema antillarum TaxID=105358 RepID=UPI003A8C7D91
MAERYVYNKRAREDLKAAKAIADRLASRGWCNSICQGRDCSASYNFVNTPNRPTSTLSDQQNMGTLELSLRYPTGVHVGMEPECNGFHSLDDHDEHEPEEDVWTLMSMMHAMIVVTMVLVLDTAQIFLRDSTDVRPILLSHVEGFFIFLYLVSIAWMIVVIVLKRPLPSSDDEERVDTQAGSRYLNVGLLFFGTGSCLWAIMRTASHIEKNGGPCGPRGIFAFGSILSVAFTMLQIYYFWRFSRYCIVRWQALAKMALMHLCANNVAVWARTMIEETWEDFLLKYMKGTGYGGKGGGGKGYDKGAGDKGAKLLQELVGYTTPTWIYGIYGDPVYGYGPYGGAEQEPHEVIYNGTYGVNATTPPIEECLDGKYDKGLGLATYKASVFLYSFTVEYSIIGGAMAYVMWRNIGRKVHTSFKPHESTDMSFSFECGLLLGVLCTMCGVIILILNIIYLGDPEKSEESFVSIHGYRIFLNFVSILGCVLAFIGIHRGGWQTDHNAGPAHRVDAALLWICVTGVFLQGIYTFVASAASLGVSKHAGLIWVDESTHLIQTIMQVILILDAMHRKPPEDFKQTRTKQIIMFMLVCNITWWLVNTYELKGGYDLFALENNYYGATAWYVIVHIAAPLKILFRFHSTACFFEVWSTKGVDPNAGH